MIGNFLLQVTLGLKGKANDHTLAGMRGLYHFWSKLANTPRQLIVANKCSNLLEKTTENEKGCLSCGSFFSQVIHTLILFSEPTNLKEYLEEQQHLKFLAGQNYAVWRLELEIPEFEYRTPELPDGITSHDIAMMPGRRLDVSDPGTKQGISIFFSLN